MQSKRALSSYSAYVLLIESIMGFIVKPVARFNAMVFYQK
jgi:hypothetical protein